MATNRNGPGLMNNPRSTPSAPKAPKPSGVGGNMAAGARSGLATALSTPSQGKSAPARSRVSQSVKGPKPSGRTNSTQPMSRGKIVHASNGAVGTSRPQNVVTSTRKR